MDAHDDNNDNDGGGGGEKSRQRALNHQSLRVIGSLDKDAMLHTNTMKKTAAHVGVTHATPRATQRRLYTDYSFD